MKKVLYPILAVVTFLVMQGLASVIIIGILAVLHPGSLHEITSKGSPDNILNKYPEIISWAVVLSGAATIAVVSLLGMIDWKKTWNGRNIKWTWGGGAIVAAIAGIFALDIVEEMIDLPNLMEDEFSAMASSFAGMLSIGVLGPIIEELIFREGILGHMLRGGMNKWVAITASSLVFGIIHLNPAQIPFATAMGFIFGIIYYKTGNIVIPVILHVLNNSNAVWVMYTLGDAAKDFSLVEALGGNTPAIMLMALPGLSCIIYMSIFWKKYQPKRFNK